MEMYAERKGWNVDGLEVDCRYTPAERGCPTRFELVMRMPAHLSEEQVERLQVIAAKCPVHRTLEGEVAFDERVELDLSLQDLAAALLTPEEALAMNVHGGRTDSAVLVPLFSDADGRLHAVFTKRRYDLRRHAGEISFPGGRRDDGETLAADRAARGVRGGRAAARARRSSSARSRPSARSSPTTRSIRSSA